MTPFIITAAAGQSRHKLLLAKMDHEDWADDPFTPQCNVVRYTENATNPWFEFSVAMDVASATRYRYPDRDREIMVALSSEGFVGFFGKEEGFFEKIPQAGLFAKDALKRGYLSGIQQIGEHLYACGDGLQVYKRLGRDQWIDISAGIPSSPNGELILLKDLNGPNEHSLYLIGWDGFGYWRGADNWINLSFPSSSRLNEIHIDDEKTIWICGNRGVLLRGNYRDGFSNVTPEGTSDDFLSISRFGDLIYLATSSGLRAFDGQRIFAPTTDLVPEIKDGQMVDAVDGVLWAVGYRDIVRFDGQRWERFDLPGNPPIR